MPKKRYSYSQRNDDLELSIFEEVFMTIVEYLIQLLKYLQFLSSKLSAKWNIYYQLSFQYGWPVFHFSSIPIRKRSEGSEFIRNGF